MRPVLSPDVREAIHKAVRAMLRDDVETSPEALARSAGYSLRHFTRLFYALTGETPLAMRRRLGMERAAMSLLTRRSSIGRIALDTGFESPDAFSRAFRDRYGVTPSTFRALSVVNPLLPTCNGIHAGRDLAPNLALTSSTRIMIQPKLIPFFTRPFFYREHIGANPDIAETWAVINAELSDAGLCRSNARFFTQCHSCETTPPERQVYWCGYVPDIASPPYTGFSRAELPGGTYAVFLHQGPDDLIVDTWTRAFQEWLPSSGYEYDDVCFEEYLNGFYLRSEEADERVIATAVYLRVRAKP